MGALSTRDHPLYTGEDAAACVFILARTQLPLYMGDVSVSVHGRGQPLYMHEDIFCT